jgi:hypothetical protein
MSLNITMAGDIYNSSGDIIDASLQIFVNNKNNGLTKWSDIFYTEDGSYNKNLGDPDISSQDNTLGLGNTAGEFVIIAVWINGNRDTDNIPSEFAYIIQELKGDNVYIQDIQLGIPPEIECNDWTVPDSIIQGENIIALNNNTNETSYEAFDTEHYLFKMFRDEIIFPFMGCSTVMFDFGNGFDISNVYVPEEGGDFNVSIEVSDFFGYTKICQKIVKVYYDVAPYFEDSNGDYFVNANIHIQDASTGHTSKIIDIYYDFLGEKINSESFDRILEVYQEIDITEYVTFFNAYENITVSYNKTIEMRNLPPEIHLEAIDTPKNDMDSKNYTFSHNGTDIDGYVEKVEWQIYRNNPDIDGNENWSLYYTTGPISDLSDWSYNIDDIIGDLKIRAIVYDNLGASAFEEYLIENDCSDILVSFDNIDWTKKIKILDFSLSVKKIAFIQNKQKILWDMKPTKITWDNKSIKKEFSINTTKIEWKYKTL